MLSLNPARYFQRIVNKRAIIEKKTDRSSRMPSCLYQSGTVIKIDNLDQNNLLANQTPSLSSRDTSS